MRAPALASRNLPRPSFRARRIAPAASPRCRCRCWCGCRPASTAPAAAAAAPLRMPARFCQDSRPAWPAASRFLPTSSVSGRWLPGSGSSLPPRRTACSPAAPRASACLPREPARTRARRPRRPPPPGRRPLALRRPLPCDTSALPRAPPARRLLLRIHDPPERRRVLRRAVQPRRLFPGRPRRPGCRWGVPQASRGRWHADDRCARSRPGLAAWSGTGLRAGRGSRAARGRAQTCAKPALPAARPSRRARPPGGMRGKRARPAAR